MEQKLRIYFLGSGAIAIPVLDRLVAGECLELTGCGTQPDKPQGRQCRLTPSPVGQWCAGRNLAVDKPADVNAPGFIRRLAGLRPELLLVFSFGQILAEELLRLPPSGCVNIHASLLPKYRGASPVTAAILAGDTTTGISLVQMTSGLDAGPVYAQFELQLTGNEYARALSGKLGELAAAQVCDSLRQIAARELTPRAQPETGVSFARKLRKQDARVNWGKPATLIERMVRAYHPWPGAWFILKSSRKTRKLTITEAAVEQMAAIGAGAAPGRVVQANKNGWSVACGEDVLEIRKLIPEGRKEMTGAEFIRGCPIPTGSFVDETDHCQLGELANSDCAHG